MALQPTVQLNDDLYYNPPSFENTDPNRLGHEFHFVDRGLMARDWDHIFHLITPHDSYKALYQHQPIDAIIQFATYERTDQRNLSLAQLIAHFRNPRNTSGEFFFLGTAGSSKSSTTSGSVDKTTFYPVALNIPLLTENMGYRNDSQNPAVFFPGGFLRRVSHGTTLGLVLLQWVDNEGDGERIHDVTVSIGLITGKHILFQDKVLAGIQREYDGQIDSIRMVINASLAVATNPLRKRVRFAGVCSLGVYSLHQRDHNIYLVTDCRASPLERSLHGFTA